MAHLAVHEGERLFGALEPEDVDRRAPGWQATRMSPRNLEQLLVPQRLRLRDDLAIAAYEHVVESLPCRARVDRQERQELDGVRRRVPARQDPPLGQQQPEATLVDQRVLIRGDGAEIVLGGECVVHRGEAVERDLGAGIETRIGQQRPALAEDGMVLDVAAEARQLPRKARVLGAPMLLKRRVCEPRGPRGHADARDHMRNLAQPPLLFNQPFGM